MSKEVWGYQPRNTRPAPDWEVNSQTEAVRAGLARTGFGETSEALFLNSGFTYSSAQEAFDSFTDETADILGLNSVGLDGSSKINSCTAHEGRHVMQLLDQIRTQLGMDIIKT